MLKENGHDVTVNFGQVDDYNAFDAVYVYHGEFSGGLNIFGGVEQADGSYWLRLSNTKVPVYSLGIDFPSYHEMIKNRLDRSLERGKQPLKEWLAIDLNNLKKIYETAQTVVHPTSTDKLVIGDSHATSLYRPGWMVNSVPFTTLYGALNRGLESYIHKDVNELDIYFGNIDIRHHLCRVPGDPLENTVHLVKSLIKSARKLPTRTVRVYEPLPIENESRSIPTTGFYEGKPFWGSWAQRNEVRNKFIQTLKENETGFSLVHWTAGLMNKEGELDFAYMEKPRSVHLARHSYPYWTGEDISADFK
jgi:hypothetical protein